MHRRVGTSRNAIATRKWANKVVAQFILKNSRHTSISYLEQGQSSRAKKTKLVHPVFCVTRWRSTGSRNGQISHHTAALTFGQWIIWSVNYFAGCLRAYSTASRRSTDATYAWLRQFIRQTKKAGKMKRLEGSVRSRHYIRAIWFVGNTLEQAAGTHINHIVHTLKYCGSAWLIILLLNFSVIIQLVWVCINLGVH